VLKEPFDAFAAELAELSPMFCGEKSKFSVSRINRDIRYSKDKSPYRPNRWVVLYDEKYRGTEWKEHPSFYFELMPEGYSHGLGMWCAKPSFLTAYRKKIESNPAAFQRLIKKIDKDPLFRLEGEEYKKIKNESLDPLAQKWYKKKDVLMVAGGELEEMIFSPDLPRYLAEEWARLKGMYAFLGDIEAE
jgi:uncharacterized protein (TIGR02453 family)